jgi:hypothetical protein
VDGVRIDYELLNNAASQLSALNSDIETFTTWDFPGFAPGTGGDSNAVEDLFSPDTGPGPTAMPGYGPGNLGTALGEFSQGWKGPLSNAGQQLQQLAATFKGVAQAWFDADASQAAAASASLASTEVRQYGIAQQQYNAEMKQYNQAVKAGQSETAPTAPTAPPSPLVTSGAGVSTSFTEGAADPNDHDDPQGATVSAETTTVTADGLSYKETTTFLPNQIWTANGPAVDSTQHVSNADGSTDTVTTTETASGAMTSVDVSSTGSTTTTTRASWNAPVDSGSTGGPNSHDPDPSEPSPVPPDKWSLQAP